MKFCGSRFLIFIVLTGSYCSPRNDNDRYRDLLRSQAQLPSSQNNTILEIRFGQSKADFFQYCWKMNAQKIFFNANGNQNVIFKMDSAFKSEVSWKFFPEFRNDRIVKLNAVLNYDNFAPWNSSSSADSLLKDIISVFSNWYGKSHFLVLQDSSGEKKLVKIDSNRLISIWKMNEKDIAVQFTDVTLSDNKLVSNAK